ncbi:YcjX family protein [Sinorhizobium psoraleae]|uniref:YcjX family protein n=1 Tax=Sinorhizobium psoraleae TaxID=520838 RepID=A0ABT4KLK7_9HYPH|nr:YcjX family protein [Sinorhizobium psoraleae]MCZ4092728.1 YcjX family protein [Sinorhizobium psoraleae]
MSSFKDDALIALDNLADRASGLVNPAVRLGVTGLSRAGKTVFISSLVHNLLNGGRLPVFEPIRSGRVSKVRLEPQPDDAVPRFQYERPYRRPRPGSGMAGSTRAISQLRVTLDYESASGWNRMFSPGRLSIDIVDYPGEWLLDLPLLAQDFRQFSETTVQRARAGTRASLSREWLALASVSGATAAADEGSARRLAESFTAYLQGCKADDRSLSTLPPGRFLMPGDLEGSPALTFSPLPDLPAGRAPKGSLWAMMERRYEAYKTHVVSPFFREHFARLDRQIVLVDALQAINRGQEALSDLEQALADVLACFRPGTNSWLSSLFTRRIDRVLIAATKADHLHHESHDRLERITARLVSRAAERIGMSGAGLDVMALASVRATREATVNHDGHALPVIVGTPIAGERINGEMFDGERKTAIFPGDLPQDPEVLFEAADGRSRTSKSAEAKPAMPELNFVRFRPPHLEETRGGLKLSVPHIRLDRAMQFLLGDRLA